MKFFFLFLAFWGSGGLWGQEAEKGRPTICLNMIVKNEREIITRCLDSAKPFIDYWVIIDTGSDDGTQEVIRECMKGIPGELYERPWVNFGWNRNEALDLARDKADYLLFIDADDCFEIVPGFAMPFLDQEGYLVDVRAYGGIFPRIRLIKASCDWRWDGVIHERLISSYEGALRKLEGFSIVVLGGGARSKDPHIFLKDASMLEAALREDGENSKNLFYLAQSYKYAKEFERALENFERGIRVGGCVQDTVNALYEVAWLKEGLNAPEAEVVDAYCRAYRAQPSRIEALYWLCAYYRKKERYLLGWLVGQFAMEAVTAREQRALEAWIYEYPLPLECIFCALGVKRYEEVKSLATALLSNPQLPQQIQHDLKIIIDEINAHR